MYASCWKWAILYDLWEKNCVLKDDFFDLKKYGNMNYSHDLTLMLRYFCVGSKKALLQYFTSKVLLGFSFKIINVAIFSFLKKRKWFRDTLIKKF